MKIFFYSSSVYSCHLLLTSSASVRSIPFLFFIVPIFAWNVPLVFLIIFKRFLVFPFLFFSYISLHWSMKIAFLTLLAILWNTAFRWIDLSFFPLPVVSLNFSAISQIFSAISQASSDNHFVFLHCPPTPPPPPLGMVLITAYSTMSWTSIHSSSGTLSHLIP